MIEFSKKYFFKIFFLFQKVYEKFNCFSKQYIDLKALFFSQKNYLRRNIQIFNTKKSRISNLQKLINGTKDIVFWPTSKAFNPIRGGGQI